MLIPPPRPCCDLGATRTHPYLDTPPHTYVDRLGFVYGLCDYHYEHLLRGLLRARTALHKKPGPGAGYAHRRYASKRYPRPCRG